MKNTIDCFKRSQKFNKILKDFIIKESLKKARYCNPYSTINITSISRTLPQLIQKILRPLEDWWSLGESNP